MAPDQTDPLHRAERAIGRLELENERLEEELLEARAELEARPVTSITFPTAQGGWGILGSPISGTVEYRGEADALLERISRVPRWHHGDGDEPLEVTDAELAGGFLPPLPTDTLLDDPPDSVADDRDELRRHVAELERRPCLGCKDLADAQEHTAGIVAQRDRYLADAKGLAATLERVRSERQEAIAEREAMHRGRSTVIEERDRLRQIGLDIRAALPAKYAAIPLDASVDQLAGELRRAERELAELKDLNAQLSANIVGDDRRRAEELELDRDGWRSRAHALEAQLREAGS